MNIKEHKEIRLSMLELYRKKTRVLFWKHWLGSILGHFSIIIGLELLFERNAILLFPISYVVFRYYLQAISKLRTKRLLTLIVLKGFEQESAEEIINSGKGYALFLRGFEHEYESMGGLNLGQGLGEETEALGIKVKPNFVEHLITKILSKNISLISLSDPKNSLLMLGAHRFLNTHSNWEDFVINLLPNARLIFLYFTYSSPGIRREFEILQGGRWLNKTMVIGRNVASFSQKDYKYVIQMDGDIAFTRKYERRLRKNLIQRLSAYEKETQQEGHILSTNCKKAQLIIPTRWHYIFKLLLTPILWFTTPTIFLFKVIYPNSIPEHDLHIYDVSSMFLAYYLVRIFTASDKVNTSVFGKDFESVRTGLKS